MSDNITLPRDVVERLVASWGRDTKAFIDSMDTLRTALAAPRLEVTVDPRMTPAEAAAISSALASPEPEPSGYAYRYADNVLRFNDGGWLSGWPPVEAVPYWFAPPAAAPEKRHPGYVIGNHWLETAYERICAGEAEAEVLKDCGWERVGDAQALRRDAERYKWVLGWLVRSGLLSCEACRIDTPESYGNWWILRKPSSIDGVAFVAYGSDLRDAIDAAMKEDGT